MLIGQRKENIYLILLRQEGKLLAHDWSSGCLATAYSVEKLFFCNNGVSFRDNRPFKLVHFGCFPLCQTDRSEISGTPKENGTTFSY